MAPFLYVLNFCLLLQKIHLLKFIKYQKSGGNYEVNTRMLMKFFSFFASKILFIPCHEFLGFEMYKFFLVKKRQDC